MGDIIINQSTREPINAGSEAKVIGTLQFSSSYSTGGDILSAEDVGLSKINRVQFDSLITNALTPLSTIPSVSVDGKTASIVVGTTATASAINPRVNQVAGPGPDELRLYYTLPVGTFGVGDVISGGTSGNSGVWTGNGVDGAGTYVSITVIDDLQQFTLGEVITGSISGATATLTSQIVGSYSLSTPTADVVAVGVNDTLPFTSYSHIQLGSEGQGGDTYKFNSTLQEILVEFTSGNITAATINYDSLDSGTVATPAFIEIINGADLSSYNNVPFIIYGY